MNGGTNIFGVKLTRKNGENSLILNEGKGMFGLRFKLEFKSD